MSDRPVRMLTAMAGEDFSYLPGETIPVPGDVADAWIPAGIAVEGTDATAIALTLTDTEVRLADAEQQLAEAAGDRDAAKSQAEQLVEQMAAGGERLAEVEAALEQLRTEHAAAVEDRDAMKSQAETLAEQLVARDARIAELEAQLATDTATATTSSRKRS
jgi:chromosome segregation ATPase